MLSGFASDIQGMATLHYAVFLLVVGAATLALFFLIWRNLHRARLIEDTPTARVRSAAQGHVELEGRARQLGDQPVTAPLTGTPCVWYRFRIDEERRSGRNGNSWSKVESGTSETPFVFFDGTGECLVDPRGAEVTPEVRKVWYGSTLWPGGQQKRGLFGALLGKRYRYTEERIDGGALYLLGWFDTLRSTDSTLGEEVAALLRAWKQDQAGLRRRFDSDGDGRIDADEWAQARQAAQREALQARAGRSAQPELHWVRAGRHDGHPFLISARPQHGLSGRYRRFAVFSLAGSVLAVTLLAWMLAVRF